MEIFLSVTSGISTVFSGHRSFRILGPIHIGRLGRGFLRLVSRLFLFLGKGGLVLGLYVFLRSRVDCLFFFFVLGVLRTSVGLGGCGTGLFWGTV